MQDKSIISILFLIYHDLGLNVEQSVETLIAEIMINQMMLNWAYMLGFLWWSKKLVLKGRPLLGIDIHKIVEI